MRTLIIGASENPKRVSNQAITRLRNANHEVLAIGARKGIVEDVKIITEKISFSDVHTVSLYINPRIQDEYEEYIIGLKPKRIIFNPGTENIDFRRKAAKAGIDTLDACTLVMLRTDQY